LVDEAAQEHGLGEQHEEGRIGGPVGDLGGAEDLAGSPGHDHVDHIADYVGGEDWRVQSNRASAAGRESRRKVRAEGGS